MRRAALLLTALSLALTGCIDVIDFDPVGSGASISGAWTIDGQEANAAHCATLGSSIVQIVFLDQDRPVVHTGLRFECRTASFDTDARGGSGAVVAEGEWTLQVEALDSSGLPLAVSDQLSYTVPPLTSIELPTVEFSTASVSADFTLGGLRPTRAACEAAGVSMVQLGFDQAASSLDRTEPCEVGIVGTRLPAGFDYTLQLRALDANGAVVRESPAETLRIEPGQAATLNGGVAVELGG